MKSRAVFEALGFQKDEGALTDKSPGYFYDFGNLRLTAAEVTNQFATPIFYLSGVWRDTRTIARIDYQMPREVESFEQGAALIAYAIGREFQPAFPTPWLKDAREWRDHLPWVRRQKEYEEEYKARPKCSVEKEWFKLVAKKLRPLADAATDSDLVWFAFNGETLKIVARDQVVMVQATGTAWNARYAIKAKELDRLPKRLGDPVVIDIREAGLGIDDRHIWHLAESEQLERR